jgi:hypothetical protein
VLAGLISRFTIVEYDNNPKVARYFLRNVVVLHFFGIHSHAIVNVVDPHPKFAFSGKVEYDDTLAVLFAWSEPCGFGKKW